MLFVFIEPNNIAYSTNVNIIKNNLSNNLDGLLFYRSSNNVVLKKFEKN
jgi:parallel beta-helix repeat protein